MYCLAAIGGPVGPILETTRSAAKILAIDGCEQNCAENVLVLASFQGFEHFQLGDLKFSKGQSEPTSARVRLVAQVVIEKLK